MEATKSRQWEKKPRDINLTVNNFFQRMGWQKCETLVEGHLKTTILLVELLIKKEMWNEAFSILKRSKACPEKEKEEMFPILYIKDTIKELNNKEFEDDEFNPACRMPNDKDTSKSKFLSLLDSGIEEKQVHWVDNDEKLDFAREKIFKSNQIIGFDSESYDPDFFQSQGFIKLIQIATKTDIFLFECNEQDGLKHSKEFKIFLKEFFIKKELKIITHTFSADIEDINNTFDIEIKIEDCKGIIDLTEELIYDDGSNIGLAKMVEIF